ncbi:MAG TPA: glycosyl hydrolase [Gaiellaceae bacterium]|nr:glycosyl hydrolase [Gaiellaceae bacterium]
MRRAGVLAAVLLAAVVAASARPAHASRFIRIGVYDEAQTLYGPVDRTFPLLQQLHVQEIRLNLYWGGKYGVAKTRPQRATNPADPAYDWALYDRTVAYAAQYGIHVLFSVYGTPSWAGGGRGPNVAPRRATDLRNFALAAATRYDGRYLDAQGKVIPAVKEWLAWNEPNNPIFLTPQFRRVGKKWVVQSAADYARICTAIYNGVHAAPITGERVACGGTAPRGNNNPSSSRPSVSPLAFLRAVKKAGLKSFDAWAHHPYYAGPSDQPTTKPVTAKGAPATAVTLGNIGDLIRELTRLYGNKRVWITEYGYQTNPPDGIFGVTYAKQAAYLKQAFAIARRNPRIDMMLWFLLRDDPNPNGWQSGLVTVNWAKKPAFTAFARLPH